MIFYHYTSEGAFQKIMKFGYISKGQLVINDFQNIKSIPDYQWLTLQTNLDKSDLVKGYRNIRIEIDIPEEQENGRLMNPRQWRSLIKQLGNKDFQSYNHPECNLWWLFDGYIPTKWFVGATNMHTGQPCGLSLKLTKEQAIRDCKGWTVKEDYDTEEDLNLLAEIYAEYIEKYLGQDGYETAYNVLLKAYDKYLERNENGGKA